MTAQCGGGQPHRGTDAESFTSMRSTYSEVLTVASGLVDEVLLTRGGRRERGGKEAGRGPPGGRHPPKPAETRGCCDNLKETYRRITWHISLHSFFLMADRGCVGSIGDWGVCTGALRVVYRPEGTRRAGLLSFVLSKTNKQTNHQTNKQTNKAFFPPQFTIA